MEKQTITALLDANVLYPAPVRDLLLHLADKNKAKSFRSGHAPRVGSFTPLIPLRSFHPPICAARHTWLVHSAPQAPLHSLSIYALKPTRKEVIYWLYFSANYLPA